MLSFITIKWLISKTEKQMGAISVAQYLFLSLDRHTTPEPSTCMDDLSLNLPPFSIRHRSLKELCPGGEEELKYKKVGILVENFEIDP